MSEKEASASAGERVVVEPWTSIGGEPVADCRVFRVRRDRRVNPRGGGEHDFFILDMPDWINIIPLTRENEVVMIEQYRHGIDGVTLEIPGGMVDPGETAEEAARRELWEETGYRADEVITLGRTHPNPALQNNWIHTFLAPRVTWTGPPPEHDGTEHTVVRLVPLADVPRLIRDEVITHSLVVAGFHWLFLSETRIK